MTKTDIQGEFQIGLPPGWQDQLPERRLESDEAKMDFVLRLGHWNVAQQTGGPFSAAVFCAESHEIISIGVNRVAPAHCSLAHAEAVALALAQKRQQTHDLSQSGSARHELFASGQPCVQCFGMVWWSGVTRLVVSARTSDIEELTRFREGPLPANWQQILADRSPLPAVDVTLDVCRSSGRELLKNYTATGGLNYSPGVD